MPKPTKATIRRAMARAYKLLSGDTFCASLLLAGRVTLAT